MAGSRRYRSGFCTGGFVRNGTTQQIVGSEPGSSVRNLIESKVGSSHRARSSVILLLTFNENDMKRVRLTLTQAICFLILLSSASASHPARETHQCAQPLGAVQMSLTSTYSNLHVP